jgi:hypothetical protein
MTIAILRRLFKQARINLLEHKLNNDVTRFFYLFFLLKSSGQTPWSAVGSRQRSAGGEYLPPVAQS